MPFDKIPPSLLENGVWAFLWIALTLGTTTLLGIMKLRSAKQISDDASWLKGQAQVSAREAAFTDRLENEIERLEAEMSRLHGQMADLHVAYLATNKALEDERSTNRVLVEQQSRYESKIDSLQAELEDLKRRITTEEAR